MFSPSPNRKAGEGGMPTTDVVEVSPHALAARCTVAKDEDTSEPFDKEICLPGVPDAEYTYR
jgi:hypothetical protein